MPKRSTNDFEVSNAIREVHYTRFSHKEYRSFLACSAQADVRQKKTQVLLDYLCEKYGLPYMKARVMDEPQPRKNGRTFEAFYYFRSYTIKVFNLTPKGSPVYSKMLLITILHEFMHHYDRFYLGIENTPHTKGFFARIKDLRSKLE